MNARDSIRQHAGTAVMAVVALLLGSVTMRAQKFEELFGGNCLERGNAGIRISNGGYLSVGEYYSNGPNCGTNMADVYVVKLNDNGSLAWSKTYDFGGNGDWIADVVECSNGDFAITGTTDPNSPCASGSRQAFILRISSSGALVWAATYGTPSGCEWGYRIIEAANGTAPAAPGDLVVAGEADGGNSDGYLFRVNGSTGAVVWSKKYGLNGNDGFFSLTEATSGTNAGDIIAAGFSTSWSGSSLREGFVVRVNGNTGAVGTSPQGSATYGNGLGDVWFTSVIELKVGSHAGELAYTGLYRTTINGAADIYMLETAPDPCTQISDAIYGDNLGTSHDFGNMLREVNLGAGSGLNNGDIVVTGITNLRGAWGRSDAFLMELTPVTFTLVTPGGTPAGTGFRIYGSGAIEEGWGVAPVAASAGTTTAGFYLTGVSLYNGGASSNLVAPTDQGQMYVLKTDNLGQTGCHDSAYTPQHMTPGLMPSCHGLTPATYGTKSSVSTTISSPTYIDTLCDDSLHSGPPPTLIFGGLHGADPGATSGVRGADESNAADLIRFYPNPVKKGDAISVDLGTLRSATRIVVTDVTGKEMARENRWTQGGTVTIGTRDWSAGVYLVTVTSGTVTRTGRVVLLDK